MNFVLAVPKEINKAYKICNLEIWLFQTNDLQFYIY